MPPSRSREGCRRAPVRKRPLAGPSVRCRARSRSGTSSSGLCMWLNLRAHHRTVGTVYPNEKLIDALTPAYGPCRHMLTHGGGCPESQWSPAAGHVPRGFLGATGELDEVELVMVLAEPGNPKRTENYVGSLAPADLLRRVVDFVHWTYANRDGTVQCVVRWFLDRRFHGMDFDHQLRRVWITQSRLCSLDESGASARTSLYTRCESHYLVAQLRLFPSVPIVAFGGKAQSALRRLKVDVPVFEVPHPSARGSEESRRSEWERAIAELQSREDPRGPTYAGAPRRPAQQWPNSDRQVHQRRTIRDRPQHHEGVAERVTTHDLPEPVAVFLVAAAKAGYEVRWSNRQNLSFLYEGHWLGGWNYKAKHWYLRASAVGEHSSLPSQYGFEPRRNGAHWQRSGRKVPGDATDAFHSVVKALTGVAIPISD